MIKNNLSRFRKNPLGFIKRVFHKVIIGPSKYSRDNDYDAEKYWKDRFSKYNLSLKGVGDEGLSEEENKKMYLEAAGVLMDLCKRESIDFQNVNVLEVGCGAGFYAQFFDDLGVKKYTGIDITDALFLELKRNFPRFKFIKKDVTSDRIKGKFDLIIMIDVIEHIVKESRLSSAMENIKDCLADNGIFMISPVNNISKKHLFYLRSWSIKDIKQRFPGYIFKNLASFRDANMLVIKKP